MIRRIARALLVATIVAAGVTWQGRHVAAQTTLPCGTAMRVLVVSHDGSEAELPAIRSRVSPQFRSRWWNRSSFWSNNR